MKRLKFHIKIYKIFRYFPRFIVSGVITNIAFYSCFSIFHHLTGSHVIAVSVAYPISIMVGIFLHSIFSFDIGKPDLSNIIKYVALYFTSYIANLFILDVGVNNYAFQVYFVQAFATVFVVIFNYLGLRFFVFYSRLYNKSYK